MRGLCILSLFENGIVWIVGQEKRVGQCEIEVF